MKFTESSLISNMIAEGRGMMMLLDVKNVTDIMQVLFSGSADFLREVKTKDHQTALCVIDLKGNLLNAFVTEYTEGEDGNPGNWDLYCTSNEDDIKDAIKYTFNDSNIKPIFNKRAFDDYRMKFQSEEFLPQLAIKFTSMLLDFLDQNATEGETFTVEEEGYFLATVDIVNGEKVKSIQPAGAIKRLIKDDESASKVA